MSARTALLNFARRAAKAPAQITRRNMSGGGTVEEEIAEMQKWRTVTYAAVPACMALGVYLFSKEHDHSHKERPAYSYLHIRNKILPWGTDCGLFEFGECETRSTE